MDHQTRLMRANMFQIAAHGAAGQVRKYSGEPYHTHPQAVAHILQVHVPEATTEMIEAAYLHDVVEDTKVSYETINFYFGEKVDGYVRGLTNVEAKYPNGVRKLNRAAQKAVNARRLSKQCDEVKIIKLCDRSHNLMSVARDDPKFASVYAKETRHLMDEALKGVHDGLWNRLDAIVEEILDKDGK